MKYVDRLLSFLCVIEVRLRSVDYKNCNSLRNFDLVLKKVELQWKVTLRSIIHIKYVDRVPSYLCKNEVQSLEATTL